MGRTVVTAHMAAGCLLIETASEQLIARQINPVEMPGLTSGACVDGHASFCSGVLHHELAEKLPTQMDKPAGSGCVKSMPGFRAAKSEACVSVVG